MTKDVVKLRRAALASDAVLVRCLSEMAESTVGGHLVSGPQTAVVLQGLDMPNVQLVINYSVPLSEKTYRHRIGRTARAGQPGTAITLITRDVAHSFLELEASLAPYLPVRADGPQKAPVACIPRWPIPIPGPTGKQGMLTRRRLADEAWSKAGKLIRSQDAERKKALARNRGVADDDDISDEDEEMDETDNTDSAYSESSVSDGNIRSHQPVPNKPSVDESDRLDPVQTLNMPLATSGLAGIQAARQTWRALTRERRKRRRERQAIRESHRENKGWGLRTLKATERKRNDQADVDADTSDAVAATEEEDLSDTDHLRFEETLKAKYSKTEKGAKRVHKL
ncbi:unnamed protein product [Echinostoma caproni]|uniref:Helicase C-terminal domain-containing protein n=1 Tax=Echinostoma caproni TaxID=27848 RepID=A0A183ALV8_9TREM|nr:unnamed protein product [Echinostoma caproni]